MYLVLFFPEKLYRYRINMQLIEGQVCVYKKKTDVVFLEDDKGFSCSDWVGQVIPPAGSVNEKVIHLQNASF